MMVIRRKRLRAQWIWSQMGNKASRAASQAEYDASLLLQLGQYSQIARIVTFQGSVLAVIYKELSEDDGFITTAFFTRKPKKRGKVWPK